MLFKRSLEQLNSYYKARRTYRRASFQAPSCIKVSPETFPQARHQTFGAFSGPVSPEPFRPSEKLSE